MSAFDPKRTWAGTFGGFGLLPTITGQGSAYRRRWLRDQLCSRLQNREHRYGAQWLALSARLGELSEASSARTPELKELWHTMADSYRCLMEYDESATTFHSWQRNNIPSLTE